MTRKTTVEMAMIRGILDLTRKNGVRKTKLVMAMIREILDFTRGVISISRRGILDLTRKSSIFKALIYNLNQNVK